MVRRFFLLLKSATKVVIMLFLYCAICSAEVTQIENPPDALHNEVYDQADFKFKSCASLNDTQKKAKYMLQVGSRPTSGPKHIDFLRKLAEMIETSLVENFSLVNNMLSCIQSEPTVDCPANLKNWIQKDFPKAALDARFHLKMAEAERQAFGSATSSIDLSGTFKIAPWTPLNVHELKRVNQTRQNYREQFIRKYFVERKSIPYDEAVLAMTRSVRHGFEWHRQAFTRGESRLNPDQLEELRILKSYYLAIQNTQQKHRDRYIEIMSDVPLLTYIKSENPNSKEILEAVIQMRLNALGELKKIKQIAQRLSLSEQAPLAAQELILYKTITEDFLSKNPEYCPLANASANAMKNREFVLNVATQLPVLTASFFLPPLRVAALVFGSSLVSTGVSYKSLQEKKHLAFTRPNDLHRKSIESLGSLRISEDELKTEITMIGVDTVLGMSTSVAGQIFRKYRAPLSAYKSQ